MAAPLVLGHSGLVGQALLAEDGALKVFASGRGEFDLNNDFISIKSAIARMGAKVCINCIAMANVDECEKNPALAWRVNSLGPARLAAACAQLGIKLIHLSTDYVFNGQARKPYDEAQACAPLNVYGQSKLAGELGVMLHQPQALVVRTCWVFGRGREGWLERPWRQCQQGQIARVVDDQVASPTRAADLARALLFLAHSGAGGLLHAANSGYASRYEVCCEFFAKAGLPLDKIQPAKSADFPNAALRPVFSALDCARLAGLGFVMPSWQSALAGHVEEII